MDTATSFLISDWK